MKYINNWMNIYNQHKVYRYYIICLVGYMLSAGTLIPTNIGNICVGAGFFLGVLHSGLAFIKSEE